MEVLVKLTLRVETKINLTEYGYDDNTRFEDLTEEQRNEILDPMRESAIPDVTFETIEE